MNNAVFSVSDGTQQLQVLRWNNQWFQFLCSGVVFSEFGKQQFELLGVLNGSWESILDFLFGGVVLIVHLNN